MTPYKLKRLSYKKLVDHWIGNLLVAHAVMSEMPNESIYPDLGNWCKSIERCGSPACFGGWVVRIPYFQAQGIYASNIGSPELRDGEGSVSSSYYLFGESWMFNSRDSDDGWSVSDRQVILNRIERQIDALLLTE